MEQSDSDSETSAHPPSVFVPEGQNGAAQPDEDDESMLQREHPQHTFC